MFSLSGAARTLIIWFTLFFVFSAYALLQYGTLILKSLMSHSGLYTWDLAVRTVQPDMMPPGLITVLLVLCVFAIGSLMATAFLLLWHAVFQLASPHDDSPYRLRETTQLKK